MNIHLIWAQDENGGIGKNNSLPWHVSEDLINFKKITLNNTIVMGRKTWESLPKKPLPKRRNIVMSSNKVNDVECYTSIESCLQSLEKDNIPDVFIIGGEMIYNAFFEYADTLHITFISNSVNGIDTFFPIPMDKIKISYKMKLEEKLSDNCIYTIWNKK